MKKKELLTIFIIPSNSTEAKKYRVSLRLFKAARVALAMAVFVCSYIIADYASTRFEAGYLSRLKMENVAQRMELHSLSSKISELESRLTKLRVFDKKLRMMANLEEQVSSEGGGILGMGGPSPQGEYFLSLDAKKEGLVDRMHSDVAQLETETELQEKSFTELQEFLVKESSLVASTPSVWPSRGWVTSTYGTRRDPFTGQVQFHRGLDIANGAGTAVISPAAGVVTKVTAMAGLGRVVEISHGYGIKTHYGHLSEVYVRVGRKVKRGDKVAAMGNSGRSTGPHLHYEVVVNGVNVDPLKYILN
ncbi:MAG: M23 family metallopeptidase [Deltaproteobacteria bacterium]|nr:M23 family metallopeptidase [Deltaproteobacteria bacterium]